MRGACPPGKWTKSIILEVRASYARGTQSASSTTTQTSIQSVPTASVSDTTPVQPSNSTSPHAPESVPETAEKDVAKEDGIVSSDKKDKENRELGKDRIGDVEDKTEEPINEQPHDHQPLEDDNNHISSEDNHLPPSRIPAIDNENITVDTTSSPGNPLLLLSDNHQDPTDMESETREVPHLDADPDHGATISTTHPGTSDPEIQKEFAIPFLASFSITAKNGNGNNGKSLKKDNHLPPSRIPTIDNENIAVDSTSSPGNPPLLPSDPPSRIPTIDNEKNTTVDTTSSPGNPPLLPSDNHQDTQNPTNTEFETREVPHFGVDPDPSIFLIRRRTRIEAMMATCPPPPPPPESSEPLSRYESQKRRDWRTFLQYVKNHKLPLTVASCNGAHVIGLLKYLDQFGKTKVHADGCPYLGHPNPPASCACPLRQAWGSLDSLVGRLRAAYEENGGKAESNPFGSKAVRIYLREVRDSQAKARGVSYEKKKRKCSNSTTKPAETTEVGGTSDVAGGGDHVALATTTSKVGDNQAKARGVSYEKKRKCSNSTPKPAETTEVGGTSDVAGGGGTSDVAGGGGAGGGGGDHVAPATTTSEVRESQAKEKKRKCPNSTTEPDETTKVGGGGGGDGGDHVAPATTPEVGGTSNVAGGGDRVAPATTTDVIV